MEHKGVPGQGIRLDAAITASAIASNVLTVTVGAAEAAKYVVGQQVITSGLTTDVTSATSITGISGGDITMALTASNAADNGTGTLRSASSMAILVAKDWCWYSDTGFPEVYIEKRTDTAGHVLQLITHLGYAAHTGGVKVLHLPVS